MFPDLTLWVGALVTLAIVSVVYRDNVIYRYASITIVGAASAHSLMVAVTSIMNVGITPMISGGAPWMIIPLILSALLFASFSRTYNWLQRYPAALIVGVGIGIMVGLQIRPQLITQVTSTVVSLFTGTTALDAFNAILVLIGVVTTMCFFVFISARPLHTRTFGGLARIGRLFVMISFGPYWAGEIAFYASITIGQLILLVNWAHSWFGFPPI